MIGQIVVLRLFPSMQLLDFLLFNYKMPYETYNKFSTPQTNSSLELALNAENTITT